jgi:hypothetical protein
MKRQKTILWVFILVLASLMCSCNKGGKTGALNWKLKDGTLTISGQGAMPDYLSSGPWNGSVNDKGPTITTIIIEEGVTNIGNNAFAEYCDRVEYISIPNSVTKIGENAFKGCENITSITLPAILTNIEKAAFENCEKLTSIYIPDNVVNIGELAFYGCHELKSVSLGIKVAFIGCNAFKCCTNIQSVTSTNSVPPILETRVKTNEIFVISLDDSSKNGTKTELDDNSAFNNVAKNCRLIVPDKYKTIYKKDKEWSKFYNYYNKNKRKIVVCI